MPSLKEILADAANYGDDDEISIKGVPMKLGELRQYAAAEASETAAQMQTRLQQLNDYEANLRSTADQLAEAQAEVERAKGQNTGQKSIIDQLAELTRSTKKTVYDEPGEYFEPVVQDLKSLKSMKDELQKQIDSFKEEANKMVKWSIKRSIETDFDRLPDRPKDLSVKQLIEHATKRKMVDDVGYPQLREAYDDYMAPQRAETERKRIREEEREVARKEVRAEERKNSAPRGTAGTFVPMPGNRGKALPAQTKGSRPGQFADTETILNDPDIMANFQQ